MLKGEPLAPPKFNPHIREWSRLESNGQSLLVLGLIGLKGLEHQLDLGPKDYISFYTHAVRGLREAILGREYPLTQDLVTRKGAKSKALSLLHRCFSQGILGNEEIILPSLPAQVLVDLGIIKNPAVIKEIELREQSRTGNKDRGQRADNRLRVIHNPDKATYELDGKKLVDCVYISETFTRSLPPNEQGYIIEANQSAIYVLGKDSKNKVVMYQIANELYDPHIHMQVTSGGYSGWERVSVNPGHLRSFKQKAEKYPIPASNEDIAVLLTHLDFVLSRRDI